MCSSDLMHKEFADVIQKIAEAQGEVAPETIMDKFKEEYLIYKTDNEYPFEFTSCKISDSGDKDTEVQLLFKYKGEVKNIKAIGNGPIDAVKNAIQDTAGLNFKLLDYSEHALSEGSHAKAAAYIQLLDLTTGKATFGVGESSNITKASIRALFSAIDRLLR